MTMTPNNPENFADLLTIARAQTKPQRLLFVFTHAGADTQYTDSQAAQFKRGEGGFLTPIMCVDKPLDELTNFAALVEESKKTDQEWTLVFVACLEGSNNTMPTSIDANKPLDAMIAAINNGMISQYLAFNKAGELLSLIGE